ncbi:hypothetical protein [Azospirillum sp. Sh1]|uniref:hypothetical protein n=1 Tax=Azospirillum sp. Sh1 TaxID=2607285 RepID=UPI0011EC79F1|nr:hypothetical protein [Azospirillum sp. Sh1]KAA0571069.1 hypothetical protein FZ029_27845 [Azospirillum sp. Sh1]
MTVLVADASGVVRGTFQIPEGIPAGTKKVEFLGQGGSYGTSTFTGAGTVEVQQMRTVEVVETHFYDPLAQTFSLDFGRHIGGVEVPFAVRGANVVRAQIRETQVGFPSRVILAQGEVNPSAIQLGGAWTRITFDPVWLDANTEYALVLLTDDADAAVCVAQLGKYDSVNQQWITRQPAMGVLLSSSNASTWTAHQDLDLTFRLLGCRFTVTTREIPLGAITANQVSDLIALARVERPAVDTDLVLVLTDEDGDEMRVVNGQVVSLTQRLSGQVAVKAVLSGTDLRSPVLYPGIQAVLGNVQESATYITRQFECAGATKILIAYEAMLGGSATVVAHAQKADASWVQIPVIGGKQVGDGWQEVIHSLSPFNVDATRVRLTLTGSVIYRPRVRALQVIAQ